MSAALEMRLLLPRRRSRLGANWHLARVSPGRRAKARFLWAFRARLSRALIQNKKTKAKRFPPRKTQCWVGPGFSPDINQANSLAFRP
jgi:hypothetical protein